VITPFQSLALSSIIRTMKSSKKPSLSLKELQEKIKVLLDPVAHPKLGAMLALVEELGECTKEVMALEIYQTSQNCDGLRSELADTLIALIEVANCYEIDLTESVESKIDELKNRIPSWQKQFGPNLKRRRKRLDG